MKTPRKKFAKIHRVELSAQKVISEFCEVPIHPDSSGQVAETSGNKAVTPKLQLVISLRRAKSNDALIRQIISDEESSLASSAGQTDRPERKSMLYRTPRRGTGVEMDLDTRKANNLLQKGKEALEAAGNMKRECKTTTYECLQGLYETAELSLMRTDLSDTKKEARGIREWLGHETLNAFKGIKEVKEEVKTAKLLITKEHEKTRLSTVGTPGDPK
ncbi:hypothetical protein HW555_005640 [Spodoptera exigua]|uniref:Uncharacterized protein n=1 Tax=Spodoptera exigua TaxID=7107 RepID=A0A835GJE9_SPOEX|nr:hypothetical protein HW555_005640 [Spodoptera exigua]